MPHGHSKSTGSSAGAGKSAGNSINNCGGGVLSRVLGSFRSHSYNDDATLKNKEDTNWANTYKITHRPDRPHHDKREGLRHHNSAYVLGELHKIWRHNQKIMEAEKRGRMAREETVVAGFEGSIDQDHRIRGEDGVRRDNHSVNISYAPPFPSLQTGQAPNSSRKANSPGFTRSEWRAESEEAYHQPSRYHIAAYKADKHVTYPPSSPSVMTIEVGLELERAELGTEPGGSNTNSGVDTGYAKSAPELQLLPATTYTPFKVPPQPISASLSSPQKGSVRKRQTRSSPQRTPLANRIQASSARSKALCESMALHINTDQDISASEPASPFTPITDDGHDIRNDSSSDRSFSPAKPRVCPMPLCGNNLITSIDQSQNLCAPCRSDHQPRGSIFITDVLNAFPGPRSPLGAEFSSRPPLIPDDEVSPMTRINTRNDSSRLTKDRGGRGEFKLQPAPRSRRQEQQQEHPSMSPVKRQITKHAIVSPRRGYNGSGSGNGNANSHLGFHLSRTATPMPSPPAQPSFRPREASGPLLEPKTFCPAPASTSTRHNKQRSPIAHRRRQSDLRTLAKGGNAMRGTNNNRSGSSSSSGRALARGLGINDTSGKGPVPKIDDDELYREIDSIIDCYLRLSEAPDPVNERRKAEALASYYGELPEAVEMSIKGFF